MNARHLHIALGSNQGDRIYYLTEALRRLHADPDLRVVAASRLYETAPIGPPQPDYLNAAATIETPLPAEEVLGRLQGVENALGRVRTRRWGARTLDLDLLLDGDRRIDTPRLVVPHPEMHRRAFVLFPLAEIAAQATHPVARRTIAALRGEMGEAGVRVVDYPAWSSVRKALSIA